MTENVITYGTIIIIGILAIFSFMIGIDKMIKIILGNYILTSICLAASQSITLRTTTMKKAPELATFGIKNAKFANFLDTGNMTIVLILYILLLIMIYKTSKIKITLPDDEVLKKILQFIFVPMTIISMILTLQIVILGIDGINIAAITQVAKTLKSNPYIFKFVSLTPVRIFLHGLLTIFITSEFKIKVQTDI